MILDTLAEELAFIHTSVEVDPLADGSAIVTCLDHPTGQQSERPYHGLIVSCIFTFNKDGTYERITR